MMSRQRMVALALKRFQRSESSLPIVNVILMECIEPCRFASTTPARVSYWCYFLCVLSSFLELLLLSQYCGDCAILSASGHLDGFSARLCSGSYWQRAVAVKRCDLWGFGQAHLCSGCRCCEFVLHEVLVWFNFLQYILSI